MRPSDFARLLFGDRPKGRIQVIQLRPSRSYMPIAPGGVDYYADGQVDVYIAVGLAHPRNVPRSPQRAKANQIVTVAGLWLDVDIDGPGRRQPGVPDRDAAGELVRAHLEPTIVVDSGYGVHAWFLFHEPWTFATIEERAAARQAAAQWYALHGAHATARGWHLGNTGDLARVLRPPGTLNGKHGTTVPVAVVEQAGCRYPREQLLALAATAGPIEPRDVAALTDGTSMSHGTRSDVPVPDRLRALIENLTEFADTWRCQRADGGAWSMSEYNLSLAAQLAGADWTDADIATAVRLHRLRHDPGDRKADRADYLQRTIAKARERHDREDAVAQLRQLADEGRARAAG